MKYLSAALLLCYSVQAMQYYSDDSNKKPDELSLSAIPNSDLNNGTQSNQIDKAYEFLVEGMPPEKFRAVQWNGNIYRACKKSPVFGFSFLNYDCTGKMITFTLLGNNTVEKNKSIIEEAFGRKVLLREILTREEAFGNKMVLREVQGNK